MVGTTPATFPGRPAGAVSTCSLPCPPPPRPAPWPGPAPVSARRGQGAAAAGTPAKRWPWLWWTLVRARHGQRRPLPFWSGPMRAGDHAARGPRRHVDPLRPAGAAVSHTEPTPVQRGATARRQRRGHRRPVRPDTWMHRTPGHRTPGHRTRGHWTSARPVGRTSPRRDRGRGQGNDRLAGVRTPSRPATTPGRPDLAQVTAPGGARPPRTAPRRRHLRRGPDRRRHRTAAQHRPARGRAPAHCSRVLDLEGTRRGQWDNGKLRCAGSGW
jgi:hypothetical protein